MPEIGPSPRDSPARREAYQRALEKKIVEWSQRQSEALAADVPLSIDESALVTKAEDISASEYESQFQAARLETLGIENALLQEEVARVKQQTGQRRTFFRWAIGAISLVLVFNAVIFAWHMSATSGVPSEAVLISWMSTTIVEVLGLGYIIANYLFSGSAPISTRTGRRAGLAQDT